jgi:hypothetical protein
MRSVVILLRRAKVLLLLFLLYWEVGHSPVLAQQYQEVPFSNASDEWSLFVSSDASACSVCQALLEVARTQKGDSPNFCRQIDDDRLAEFERPVWTPIKITGHLSTVRTVLAVANASWDPAVNRDLNIHGAITDEQISLLFWSKYGDGIESLIADGHVKLESTDFDVNGDAIPDRFYRITEVERLDLDLTDGVPDWVTGTCDRGRMTPGYYLYADPNESPALARLLRSLSFRGDMEVFRFKGTSYLWRRREDSSAVMMIAQRGALYYLRTVFDAYYSHIRIAPDQR